MPTIDFAGLNSTLPNGTQQIEFSSTGVVIHAGLILNVMNPNVLSMKLSDLTAKVNKKTCCIFQPLVHSHKLLLGILPYPFQIDYNPSDPNSRYLLSSISDKCGFTGNTPSDIDISYEVSLNAQVLFVHVSPTISSSASFACPFQVILCVRVCNEDLAGVSLTCFTCRRAKYLACRLLVHRAKVG
ncbi:hypothetical protein FB192DRAFT_1382102 [Mucor lusitanicus]|uniref:Uncharacterized protein n=1 Tax=Mucor circinelloides f. lusitanicus TaxID=29924 RepID=A0A8H4F0W3_MUCCL|nr:hypothetical protein FB192DRAFT_1382102 [Mucor lusitanicus]